MRLFLLAAVAVSLARPAHCQPITIAAQQPGAMFGLPNAGGMQSVQSFSAWAKREDAAPLMAGHGALAAFRQVDFQNPSQVRALTPLVNRLSGRQQQRLAGLDKLSAAEQKEALQELDAALKEATVEVAGAVRDRLAAAVKEDSHEAYSNLAGDVKALSLYGSWAAPVAEKLEAKAAKAREKKTAASIADTAEKLKGRSASARITRVDGNVVHADFSRGPNRVPADWKGADVLVMPSKEERTPPAWAKARHKELKRQINNTEILLASDLGTNASKISADIRARRAEYATESRELEDRFPRLALSGWSAPKAAPRESSGPRIMPSEAVRAYHDTLASAEELAHYIYWRNRTATLLLTGRWKEYKALRADARYPVSNSTLVAQWETKAGELDVLKSKNPGVEHAFMTPTDPMQELKDTRKTGLIALGLMAFLAFWLLVIRA